MIYSPSKGFLFVHIYKTGGNSIRRLLEPYDEGYRWYHRLKASTTKEPVLRSGRFAKHGFARQAQEDLGPQYDQLFRFAFVRNPWDWQLSLYHYILKHPENPDHPVVQGLSGFGDYVRWRVDGRVRLLSDFVDDRSGMQIVNFIGRFEHLQPDFKQVCLELSLPQMDLPHLNRGGQRDFRASYTDSTAALFEHAYQRDILRFGYEF
ncbi:MAG: sulfotransferase family 2 domain-containing protein [Bacteroidota bacterium]